MKPLFASTLVFLTASLLGGCGFTPVYGTNVSQEQGSILIPEIEGVEGHFLRQELIALLRPGLEGVENATLNVETKLTRANSAIRLDGGNVRTENRLVCSYSLVTPEGRLNGRVMGTANFFTPRTPYAEITANREGQILAAKDAAQKIVTDLQFRIREQTEKEGVSPDA